MQILTYAEIEKLVATLAQRIWHWRNSTSIALKIYPIPRGGVPVVYALLPYVFSTVVDDPAAADIFGD